MKKKKRKLIEEYRNNSHGEHFGIRKTFEKLIQEYVWKNMLNKIYKNLPYKSN